MGDIQQQVQDTVDELVAGGAERGLQVAVYQHGRQVVDAVGGTDANGRPLTAGTPIHALSTGKGVAATVVHVLVERGAFGYDTRIADVWPEFGAHGKEGVTVRHALTHTVGLPALPPGATPEMLCDWDAVCAALAGTAPSWQPGTRTGYHAQTWGFIIGEVVRRATGRRICEVLRDEVASPLGVAGELFFGVPRPDLDRVGRLEEAPGYADILLAMFATPVPPTAGFLNNPEVLASDMPFGGVMSARAVARMYAALLGAVDGVRLVPEQRLREMSAVAFSGIDAVIGFPQVWALGYGIGHPGLEARPESVFGMPGIGGSAAWADTATGTAFAITTTRLHPGVAPGLDRIGQLVVTATA